MVRGVSPGVAMGALAVAALPLAAALRWLRPHVPAEMRVAVHAYLGVISAMVVCAAGTVAATKIVASIIKGG